jgi:hypothetical protein
MSYSFSSQIQKNQLNIFSISVGELTHLTNVVEEMFEFFQACPELADSMLVTLLADSLQRSREEIDARLIFKRIVDGKSVGKENDQCKQLIHRLKGSTVLQRVEYEQYRNLITLLSDPKLLSALKCIQNPSLIDRINVIKEDPLNISLLNVLLQDKIFWKIFAEEYALKKGEDYIKHAKTWINSTKLVRQTEMYGVQNGILRWDTLKAHPDFSATLEKVKELYFGSESKMANPLFIEAINDAFVQRERIWKENYSDIGIIYNEEELRGLFLEDVFEESAVLVLMSHIYSFENELYRGNKRAFPVQIALSELGNLKYMKFISVIKSPANVALPIVKLENSNPIKSSTHSSESSSKEASNVGLSQSSISLNVPTFPVGQKTQLVAGISKEEKCSNEKEKSDQPYSHPSTENMPQSSQQTSTSNNSFSFFSSGSPIARLQFSANELSCISYIAGDKKVLHIGIFYNNEKTHIGGFTLNLFDEPTLASNPKPG